MDLRTLKAFPLKRRYLIGVSGGRDSVALLHALVAAGYTKLIVCHLDHRLRGRASTADATFVRRLSAKLRLEFEGSTADVRQLAAANKQSLETAAREARYRFFAEVARRRRCRTIFLGHHADDLVETFLLNLFRGAGPLGLSAMREISEREIDGVSVKLVRPLLRTWRDEIDDYVRANRLTFREDATNESIEPRRNRIRRRVLPLIETELGRDIRRSIWRAATIAADEETWVAEVAAESIRASAELSVRELRVQGAALQRRVIRTWLQHHRVEDISFELVERVRALADPDAAVAKTNLPRDLHVRRRAGKIFIDGVPPSSRAET